VNPSIQWANHPRAAALEAVQTHGCNVESWPTYHPAPTSSISRHPSSGMPYGHTTEKKTATSNHYPQRKDPGVTPEVGETEEGVFFNEHSHTSHHSSSEIRGQKEARSQLTKPTSRPNNPLISTTPQLTLPLRLPQTSINLSYPSPLDAIAT
jgi:hypothetical protein